MLLHSKGNHKLNEKTIHRLGENICKQWDWRGLNFQNIKTAHATQQQQQQQQKKKLADLNRHLFLQIRHTNGQ